MNSIPDCKYDSSICFEVLEHVPNPYAVIREINRIIKPNSYVIFTVPLFSPLHKSQMIFFDLQNMV